MKNPDPSQLDSIIDSALSRYASAEPLAGIEQRVLNRIAAADPGHRGSQILAWAVACPILIALLSIAIAVWAPALTQPAQIAFAPLPHVSPPPNAFVIVRPAVRQPRLRMVAASSSIVSEERRVLALVESYPAELQQIFADMQRRNDTPVEIQEIHISPLQIPEVQ